MTNIDGWRSLPAAQQPDWPDTLDAALDRLSSALPLVTPGECELLKQRLAEVSQGRAFLLQGGDCAETFADTTTESVQGKFRTLLQMALVMTFGASIPVIKMGRMAGQFAKPRSSSTETQDGVTLPAYRGDAVNGFGFTEAERAPDPERLIRMHAAAAATVNMLRAESLGGGADLRQAHSWNRDFVASSPVGVRYEALADRIDHSLDFMDACGVDPAALHTTEFFVSHEGLLLDYEDALVRRAPDTGNLYATSAHLLWIGERTRQLDGAHVEFFSRLANPVAVKLGPNVEPDEMLRLMDRLDPDREPGRLTFVARMGVGLVSDRLPVLVEKAAAEGAVASWVCDPMHGNTFQAPSGIKTRSFDDIAEEVTRFFEVHRSIGTHPGGIHLEFTGDNVTECIGGGSDLGFEDLRRSYTSTCDPRLNRTQSLDLAFQVAELMAAQRESFRADAWR
ncbi:3-deoxy-7-phosphoheptulonate synthase class II [Streptacidiphilus pinicola]|uniref:Phospho-2-dehydro-3-deoxyheptonate aldolase n=1 Tax=Streptacidiphilus pinicola TaxID=2219663 RepID=A0A2X0IV83_9ACTN|nr:3-deoxy-7-phosphoheptulonate synthase class II [Streptacidiphilus pinicola]RAG81526.1 3-deoxy-7-phosphoheptulonate synthase class II [Streptacidiphilus pinicola]